MRKNIGKLSLVVLLLVGMLSTSAFAERTVVRYAFWGNPSVLGVEEDIIAAFEKENPDIKIEPIASPYAEHHTKLLTMVAGGDAPDVMRVDSYFFQDFVERGILRTIDQFVEGDNGIDMSKYYPISLNDSIYNGKLYGLPWSSAPYYTFYNIDLFEQAGLANPSPNWTQEEYLTYAKKLTRGTGVDKVYGTMADFGYVGMLPWIWNNGGELFNEDRTRFTLHEKPATEALQWLADLIFKHKVAPSMVDMQGFSAQDWFLTNKFGIVYGMADSALYLRQGDVRFDVTVHPAGKAGQWTIWKANTVGISNSSKVPEAAWRFLKFLLEPGGTGESLYAKAKRIPPSSSIQAMWDLYADPTLPPASLHQVTTMIAEKHARQLPLRRGWSDIETRVTEYLQLIQLGDMSAEEAMNTVRPEVDSLIRRLDRK